MNMTGGPPQSTGRSVAVGVNVGVAVGVEVGVIEAVGVAVGALTVPKAAQLIIAGRRIIQTSN